MKNLFQVLKMKNLHQKAYYYPQIGALVIISACVGRVNEKIFDLY